MPKIKNKGKPPNPAKAQTKRWLSVREVEAKEGFGRKTVYVAIWKGRVVAREVLSSWQIDTKHPTYETWVKEVNEFKQQRKEVLERSKVGTRQMWDTRKDEIARHMSEVQRKRKEQLEKVAQDEHGRSVDQAG